MIDIVIAIVPICRPIPATGPALLKSNLEKNGFKCKICDWNLDYYNHSEKDFVDNTYIDITIHQKQLDLIQQLSKKWIEELKRYKPQWLGLSMYVYNSSIVIMKQLCKIIKKEIPELKIVVGGHALDYCKFGDQLLNENLADKVIYGEAENKIVNLLSNKPIDEKIFTEDINILPQPDYSDLDMMSYPQYEYCNMKGRMAYVITSRGCKNNCNFCYSPNKKFRTRNPDAVIEELNSLYHKYGIKHFVLSDCSSNADPDHLFEICNRIIDKDISIKWTCFFNCLPKNISHVKLYNRLKLSGCQTVNVGIESGSQKVRYEMNKKIKNESIIFLIEQCVENNIDLTLNFINGYYTETKEDFLETLSLLKTISNLQKGNKISIFIAPEFRLGDIELWKDKGIKLDEFGNWYYNENTFPNRVKNFFYLIDYCESLNFKVITHARERMNRLSKKYQRSE